MIARIMYPTALEYWLMDKGIPYRSELAGKDPQLFRGRKGLSDIVKYLNFSRPVHIAVPKDICRTSTKEIIYHLIPDNLPDGSFVPVFDTVYVSSPEYCLLKASLELPLDQLVKLACNLCAQYIKDPNEDYLQRRRDPITSVALITSFLETAKGLNGVNPAKRAALYALDNSNSPMETNLATLSVLPVIYGGYGLKKPVLNYNVMLSKQGADYFGREFCCCDMVWLKEKVVLEYDSNLTHLTTTQHAKDKSRATALSLSGYKVISVTAEKVRTFRDIENLFLGLRKTLGMRSRQTVMDMYFEKRWNVVKRIMA